MGVALALGEDYPLRRLGVDSGLKGQSQKQEHYDQESRHGIQRSKFLTSFGETKKPGGLQ